VIARSSDIVLCEISIKARILVSYELNEVHREFKCWLSSKALLASVVRLILIDLDILRHLIRFHR
jgi:hypothetical protein